MDVNSQGTTKRHSFFILMARWRNCSTSVRCTRTKIRSRLCKPTAQPYASSIRSRWMSYLCLNAARLMRLMRRMAIDCDLVTSGRRRCCLFGGTLLERLRLTWATAETRPSWSWCRKRTFGTARPLVALVVDQWHAAEGHVDGKVAKMFNHMHQLPRTDRRHTFTFLRQPVQPRGVQASPHQALRSTTRCTWTWTRAKINNRFTCFPKMYLAQIIYNKIRTKNGKWNLNYYWVK